MSTTPTQVTSDCVNIEIDGQTMQVPKGSMIIQAADKAGIQIPRFCYHDKLPIAANCRMCLVDVEKSPKPMPACATPVMEGMKVYTHSKRALDSQRNVMEFLLINHPLDCPICDQGGECELQDVAVGYGRSVSRFSERKRVVPDEDLGPLISTDMTRCIQCTRCVRFVSEIAGTYELGGMGRGEHLEIGTYIGKSIESELSGNIIDVCPVGALTNKVFRFRARAWELIARESIAYHDALGSNLYLHTRRGEVLRTVPRDNDAVNECWLSDRDRYSHQGLYAEDRATHPMIRKNGDLVPVTWDEAIAFVASELKRHAGTKLSTLVSPMTSCEEGYLLAAITQGLGSSHIDHRLRLTDADDLDGGIAFERPLAEVERARSVLLIGCNPRIDQPLLGHRVRKAIKQGAQVFSIHSISVDVGGVLADERVVTPNHMLNELLGLVHILAQEGMQVPSAWSAAVTAAVVDERQRKIIAALRSDPNAVVLFGDYAVQHPKSHLLRALAKYIAKHTDSAMNVLPHGPNALGLARVGVMPTKKGLVVSQGLSQAGGAVLTYHAGSQDFAYPSSYNHMRANADFHVYIGGYACNNVRKFAHAVLPIGLPPEIDGCFINVDGRIQHFTAGSKLPGDARPGWKVLRALGDALGFTQCSFNEWRPLQQAVQDLLQRYVPQEEHNDSVLSQVNAEGLVRVATLPIYRTDPVVRRAQALQDSAQAKPARAVVHKVDAQKLGLHADAQVKITVGDAQSILPLEISDRVAQGAVWIEAGYSQTAALGSTGTAISLTRVMNP